MCERLVNLYLYEPKYSYWQHMRMDGLKIAAAVAWSHKVVDGSSVLMWNVAKEGVLTMPTQASGTHALRVGTMFLGGMICWHNAVGLETQSTSPFVHVSKCQSEWSSKSLERKRSIPLVCMRARAARVKLCGARNECRFKPRLVCVCEGKG
jgi:hypothetical protein